MEKTEFCQYDSISAAEKVRPARGSRGWVARRPQSTAARLILNYYNGTCCTTQNRLPSDIPEAVHDRGVSPEEWTRFVAKLERVSRGGLSITSVVTLMISLIGVPYLIWRMRRYNRALCACVDAFNRDVLAVHGMMAKTQTAIVQIDRYHEEISWLAISLTPEDCEVLQDEGHIMFHNVCGSTHHDMSDFCGGSCNFCCATWCGEPRVI